MSAVRNSVLARALLRRQLAPLAVGGTIWQLARGGSGNGVSGPAAPAVVALATALIYEAARQSGPAVVITQPGALTVDSPWKAAVFSVVPSGNTPIAIQAGDTLISIETPTLRYSVTGPDAPGPVDTYLLKRG